MYPVAAITLVAITTVVVAGVQRERPRLNEPPTPIEVPAGPDAGIYSLAPGWPGGAPAYLSWLEPLGDRRILRVSAWTRDGWGTPATIAEGRQLFSNWADHPSVAAGPGGMLVAQWPVINPGPQPPGSYNNSMRIARSLDRGTSWRESFADGLDNTHSYTGFVSLLPMSSGVRAVYLSPPRPISHDPLDHRMTLSHVALDAEGGVVTSGVIDPDTCSCCPTALADTAAGPIAAYRDHEPGDIRDIAIVRLRDGAWTSPAPVHRDGWVLNGCPTNGPAIGARGERVAVAWFTAANDTPRMYVAFSTDSGATFGRPVQIDGSGAVGRPAALMLADGTAVVAWLASTGNGRGELRVRRVSGDGTAGPIAVAGSAPPGRTSGMPQIVQLDTRLLVAWRDDHLTTVTMPMPAAPAPRSHDNGVAPPAYP